MRTTKFYADVLHAWRLSAITTLHAATNDRRRGFVLRVKPRPAPSPSRISLSPREGMAFLLRCSGATYAEIGLFLGVNTARAYDISRRADEVLEARVHAAEGHLWGMDEIAWWRRSQGDE